MARDAGLLPRPVLPGQRPTLVAELHPDIIPAWFVNNPDTSSGNPLSSAPDLPLHASKIVLRALTELRPTGLYGVRVPVQVAKGCPATAGHG